MSIWFSEIGEGTGDIDDGTAQGQLVFWDATVEKWVNAEASELFWDDTAKNIGIGVSSPSAKLDVLATGEQLRISYNDTIYSSLETLSSNALSIKSSGGNVRLYQTVDNGGLIIYGNVDDSKRMWNYLDTSSVARWGTNGDGLVVEAASGYANFRVGTTIYFSGQKHIFRALAGTPVYSEFNSDNAEFYVQIDSINNTDPQIRCSYTEDSVYFNIECNSAGAIKAESSTGATQEFNSISLADDASYIPCTSKAGRGWVQAGDDEEYTEFRFSTTTVTLINNTTNIANSDSDTDLCIYIDTGSLTIKNRLGATKTVRYEVKYS